MYLVIEEYKCEYEILVYSTGDVPDELGDLPRFKSKDEAEKYVIGKGLLGEIILSYHNMGDDVLYLAKKGRCVPS